MLGQSLRSLWRCSSTATRFLFENVGDANRTNAGGLVQRSLHILSSPRTSFGVVAQPSLLAATGLPQMNQIAGFKVKAIVKRRCRDCFLVAHEGRVYNLCETHPRHKVMSMKKRPKSEYMLSHATQHKIRPW